MNILDNLIIISLIVLSFVAGVSLTNRFNRQAEADKKDALERQFLRLRVNADADDPVKPYAYHAPQTAHVAPILSTGDFDGDAPLDNSFMEHIRKNGRAVTKLRNKSDIAK